MLTEKLESEDKIEKIDLEMFTIFKFGIPCNSHILPEAVKKLPQLMARRNELMTGYCKVNRKNYYRIFLMFTNNDDFQVACPKTELFEVRDKNGKVLESANNSAGIYSLLQSLPPLEPTIERRLIYGVKGKTIILACPG